MFILTGGVLSSLAALGVVVPEMEGPEGAGGLLKEKFLRCINLNISIYIALYKVSTLL